jgi:acyl carrier protein
MNDAEILATLTGILRDLIGDDSLVLQPATQRADVPGWDSFAYINLIVGAEMTFGIKFSVADVESFANVGEIVAKIRALQG